MLSEERIETTSFPKLFDLQAIFGLDTALAYSASVRRESTAYSTNRYFLKQTVRWLEMFFSEYFLAKGK